MGQRDRSVNFSFLHLALFVLGIQLTKSSVIRDNHNDSTLPILNALRSNSFLGDSIDVEYGYELIQKAAIPSYLHNLIELTCDDFVKADLLAADTSDECKAHILKWQRDICPTKEQKRATWALQMLDAWGKVPEGIMNGHVNSFGDFDECIDIHVDDSDAQFDGRYCTVYMAPYEVAMNSTPVKVPRPIQNQKKVELKAAVSYDELIANLEQQQGVRIVPSVGVCFPTSCSRNDVQQIMINGLEIMYKAANVPPVKYNETLWAGTTACYQKEKPALDAADISVIALIAVITGLCLGAGALDYWLNHGVAKPPKRGTLYTYFMAFSLYTNIRKWMSTRKGAEDLGCLHGIRFFSTSWVVLAHTYYVITFLPQWNMIDVKNVYQDWSVLTVINSTFAVDTFFVLSGMLVTYNILKVLTKTKGKLNIIMLYVHRYLRLTPTYAILIGIMATILPLMGNGPYWQIMTRWGTICEDNWWSNMLYINNFWNTSWLCQGEAWYLANDMQFYVVSPFILYPMWRWEMIGMILLAIYTVLSIICPALLVHLYDTTPTTLPTRDIGKWFTHIYIRPYARIQTFLVGVWLGWILHKTRGKKVKLPKIVVLLGWVYSIAVLPTLLYSIQDWFDPDFKIPKVSGLAYAGLSRVAWGVMVSWVIFACIKGYGGLVNSFLSWSPFMPLGRLCYCVYLVSLHLQMILHLRFTQPIRYDAYTQLNFFFAHLLMSFMVGFFCTLLFESPFMILQKLIFEGQGGGRRPAQDTKNMKRPSKRYGIFYNDEKTIIEGLPAGGKSEVDGIQKERVD